MCMGPPLCELDNPIRRGVYPHVYGATYLWAARCTEVEGLSPCVWGHRGRKKPTMQNTGSIPMCMGPPITSTAYIAPWRVDPPSYWATQRVVHLKSNGECLIP